MFDVVVLALKKLYKRGNRVQREQLFLLFYWGTNVEWLGNNLIFQSEFGPPCGKSQIYILHFHW